LKREIVALQAQLTQLESKGAPGANLELSAGTLPANSLAYLRKVRDVKYHETLYELLSRQYEVALMDEARQAPVIQVIDRADIPDHRSGPRRRLIIMESALAGMVLGSAYIAVDYYLKMLRGGGLPLHT
jgi:tyrosine-protein kinase Etk/Wzc